MSTINFNKNKLRWFWIGVLVCQLELIVLLLLYSIRGVWSFVNKFIDGAIGLKEHSFTVVYAFLIILFFVSVFYLVFLKRAKTKKFSKVMIGFFIFQCVLFVALFIQLYPNLVSMYLSQLPHWLFKERVLIIIIISAIVFTSYFLLNYRAKKDFKLKTIIALNGILLFGVLSFAWMATTVRSSDFGENSLESVLKNSNDYFTIDTKNTERFPSNSPNTIHPDISLKLDMENGGNYLVAGDLTGDGIIEVITLKYWVEPIDVNRIKSVAVQSMLVDSVSGERGETLWSWESEYEAPTNIGGGRGSSAAVAVFDLETGKENHKLLMATDGWLYEFTFDSNGFISEKKVPTGTVDASDCLIIANLDGKGKHQLLLKDAYHTIWAYDKDLNLLWKTKNPGGYLLAHRIGAYDINNDGKDEILAGVTILNGNGKVITHLKTNTVKLWYGGHIDGIVPIQQNGKWYISVTYCDGLGFALFDEKGNMEWEITGDHFEYLVGGYFFNTPELKDQFQLISKVHYKAGDPQIMMNQDGKFLGMFNPSSAAFSVDWIGNGYHALVFSSPASIWLGTQKIADLVISDNESGSAFSLRVADMIGKNNMKPDGIPDIALRAVNSLGEHYLYLYTNKSGKMPTNYVYPGIGWESSANYFTKYYEYERQKNSSEKLGDKKED
jgi:hypothetical protein